MKFYFSVHCQICQFTAAIQIAERQRSMDIMIFLMRFHFSSHIPFPKEFVCDGSRALLNAAVSVYSPMYCDIDEYADVLENVEVKTRIRQDVAHFMNIYSKLFKKLPRQVRTQYMAAVGALVKTTCQKIAENIIKSIFLLSECETEGSLENGELTECCKIKKWIISYVTGIFFSHIYIYYL